MAWKIDIIYKIWPVRKLCQPLSCISQQSLSGITCNKNVCCFFTPWPPDWNVCVFFTLWAPDWLSSRRYWARLFWYQILIRFFGKCRWADISFVKGSCRYAFFLNACSSVACWYGVKGTRGCRAVRSIDEVFFLLAPKMKNEIRFIILLQNKIRFIILLQNKIRFVYVQSSL